MEILLLIKRNNQFLIPLRSKIETASYMRYSTEIIQYTLHIFSMDSFALKKHTKYLKN